MDIKKNYERKIKKKNKNIMRKKKNYRNIGEMHITQVIIKKK